MRNILLKLTKKLTKRYLPEAVSLESIWSSEEYLKAIQYVDEAEKTKSHGQFKREYVQAHLKFWYQEKAIPKPRDSYINLLIELAIWRNNRWI